MLYLNKPKFVHVYLGRVDFRKQAAGLMALVELHLPSANHDECWYVFISRDRRKIKLLYWRGAGVCLWQYRLEKEKFSLKFSSDKAIYHPATWNQLRMFLNGLNIFAGTPHKEEKSKRYS